MASQADIPIARTIEGIPVVLTPHDFERHLYLVGKTGSGKSTMLFNIAMSRIMAGESVVVVDPHGDLALELLDAMPKWRIHDTCYLDATDLDRPVGFNPLAGVAPERRALAAAGVVSTFKHRWSDSWGPRLEHFLYHGVAALLSNPSAMLIDLPRVFTNDAYRDKLLKHSQDSETLRFWREEYPSYTKALRSDAIAPILNKVGQFTASPNLRLILGQAAPAFDLRRHMNSHGIMVANLAKGVIGEGASNLLGSLIVSHLQLLAMERASLPPAERVPVFLFVDEIQNFSSDSFAVLLSEARKFSCFLCCANQFTAQLTPAVRNSVLGNVGTLIAFRVGSEDAELLAPEFRPMDDGGLTDQQPFSAWMRRGIDRSRIYAADKQYEPRGHMESVRRVSRERFGRARYKIEERWTTGATH
jgi:hypothetical protein